MLKHDVKVSSSYSSVLRRSGALARDVKNMDAPGTDGGSLVSRASLRNTLILTLTTH